MRRIALALVAVVVILGIAAGPASASGYTNIPAKGERVGVHRHKVWLIGEYGNATTTAFPLCRKGLRVRRARVTNWMQGADFITFHPKVSRAGRGRAELSGFIYAPNEWEWWAAWMVVRYRCAR